MDLGHDCVLYVDVLGGRLLNYVQVHQRRLDHAPSCRIGLRFEDASPAPPSRPLTSAATRSLSLAPGQVAAFSKEPWRDARGDASRH